MTLLAHRDYDPLSLGSPLRRRGPCLAVCVGLAILLGFAALVQLSLIGGMRPDVASVFLRALLLSSLLALVPLRILWYLDRRERETPWLFAAAFFWGGLIATGLALPFNTAFAQLVDAWVTANPVVREVLGPDAVGMLSAPISAPIIEEATKALGVLVIFWLLRDEFDNMRDGIVYGALVGVGFTWFEAPIYVAQGYAETGVAPWGMQLGWRYALFGFGGHALFTALFGASLGLVLQTRRRWLRVLAPIGGLALAVTAHALNNALPLFFAIAAAAAGEPPPRGRLRGSQSRLLPGVPVRQPVRAHDFPAVRGDSRVRALAQRGLGAPRDPRRARGGGRADREPAGVRRDCCRPHVPHPPDRSAVPARVGGDGERAARARVPQTARTGRGPWTRRTIAWSPGGASRSGG